MKCEHIWKTYKSIISHTQNFDYCQTCGVKKLDWAKEVVFNLSDTPTEPRPLSFNVIPKMAEYSEGAQLEIQWPIGKGKELQDMARAAASYRACYIPTIETWPHDRYQTVKLPTVELSKDFEVGQVFTVASVNRATGELTLNLGNKRLDDELRGLYIKLEQMKS